VIWAEQALPAARPPVPVPVPRRALVAVAEERCGTCQ
jgi:hypothetical protein